MFKRIAVLVFILSAFALLALAPMNVSSAAANAHKLQTTVESSPVVGVTVVVGATSAPGTIPATGGGLPMSTLIIFGLLAIIGIAVVIGGIAMVNRNQ